MENLIAMSTKLRFQFETHCEYTEKLDRIHRNNSCKTEVISLPTQNQCRPNEVICVDQKTIIKQRLESREIQDMKSKIEKLVAQSANKDSQIKLLVMKEREINDEKAALSSELEKIREDSKTNARYVKTITKEFDLLMLTVTRIKESHAFLMTEFDCMKQQCATKDVKLDEAIRKCKSLVSDNEVLKANGEEKDSKLKLQYIQNKTLEAEMKGLSMQITEEKKRLDYTQRQLKKVSEHYDSEINNSLILQHTLEECSENLMKSQEELNKNNATLKNITTENMKTLTQYQAQVDDLLQQLRTSQDKMICKTFQSSKTVESGQHLDRLERKRKMMEEESVSAHTKLVSHAGQPESLHHTTAISSVTSKTQNCPVCGESAYGLMFKCRQCQNEYHSQCSKKGRKSDMDSVHSLRGPFCCSSCLGP